jgi:nucleotide-binding universal stress UspA family protein
MAIEPVGPVVVGVDGSSASLAALDLAADEAVARVTPLVVVCAADELAGAQRAEILDAAVARALAEHPGLSVGAQSAAGAAAPALLAALNDASLGVIGYAGKRGTGSVARDVLARAGVPVIVHRPFDGAARVELPRPVLVGVVASEGCDDLLGFAFEEAQLRGAPLHAAHVCAGVADQAVRDRLLTEALSVWSQKYADVGVTRTVRPGVDAAVVLSAASRSAQLVVVGAGRRRAGVAFGPGSVVGVLLGRAGCPVAVVASAGGWS